MLRPMIALVLALSLHGCGPMSVRQQDLDAWVGVPIEALDTHSLFITIPMYKSMTDSGIEVRNYANGKDIAQCFGNATSYGQAKFANSSSFATCVGNRIVCNNIFYIRDGKVIEYAPTGRCYTDETVQPEARYRRLMQKSGS